MSSKKRSKRHPITLLEIMIVILLIGVIGGVLSYNLKGTLDRGKKFRTEEGISRLKEILDLEVERGIYTKEVLAEKFDKVQECVAGSGFIPSSNLNAFLKDGWGKPYKITLEKNELVITSETSGQRSKE